MAINKTLPDIALPRVQSSSLVPKMTELPHMPLKHPFLQPVLSSWPWKRAFSISLLFFTFLPQLNKCHRHCRRAWLGTGDTAWDTRPH